MPGTTAEFLKALDKKVGKATVEKRDDLDYFELGKQAGKRALVEELITDWKRHNE